MTISQHGLAGALALVSLGATVGAGPAASLELTSPDGKVTVCFELQDIGGEKACPVYRVSFGGRPVLADSRLGLGLRDLSLTHGFELADRRFNASDTTWRPVLGERETVRDHYHELAVHLQDTGSAGRMRRLTLTFRAYNQGVALRYTIPRANGPTAVIVGETTQFAFPGEPVAWAVDRAQGDYTLSRVPLSELPPGTERPLTVRVADDLYAAITEARLVDFARMKLRRTEGRSNTLEAVLDAERGPLGAVTGETPLTSPWRVVMLADSPGGLLEGNDLILNLNDPCALADTSWIRPGKVIRETTLTTAGGKACVEFALSHGLQFIEYDAGWYGREEDPASDARDVHLDPRRNPDPTSLNLREVIDYANSRGIGVILYVNHLALEKQLDDLLPLYESWGVRGVKYGFVNVGSQRWTTWLHEAIRKAAAHHLMVDIHDEFRSTGYQRTYPNLMTVEGILGNEGFPSPVHNATLPFTRFLTGPGDYTYCWTSGRLKVTHAHQLALSTLYFSPWQFLFWYDRPGQVPDEPALDYWRHLPTTWDETRVLQGEIGRRAVIARRQGDEWFVGAIAPVDGRFPIPLDFLPPGRAFHARVYSDNPEGPGIRIEERMVDSQSELEANIPPNGGLAVRLVPGRGKP